MSPIYKRPFRNFVKKAHKPLQLAIEDEVESICEHPYVGERKLGDLAGFYVRKFLFNRQQYLIAYRPPAEGLVASQADIEFMVIEFYKVGVHESFYEELKHYIQEE